ncbi:MAG TPA: phosphate ABC transporter substrate-binding protein PstS [Candidatus Acidoferrum sp.]|nr:phosphate ABC transporter substrate-binding protein PstS [Candidatus Acidoferrum sp.]
MPEPRSPFPSRLDQEFLTIRISKLTLVNGLLAVIVVISLVALVLRERPKSQTALASTLIVSQAQEPAVVSPPPSSGRPPGARAEATVAAPANQMQPVERQLQIEGSNDSSYPTQPETAKELPSSQIIYREPPATDSAPAQPEVRPDDPPQPADQPNQPAAPSPRTSDTPPARPDPAFPTTLNGAGATYPYPVYAKWFDEYHKLNPQIQINYQSVGSGAGVRYLLDGAIDFGATDVPTFDEQLSRSRPPIVHIPTVLGAIVPIYNIPGVSREVVFTPEMLAGIYLGKITSWSDPSIANANRAVSFPNLPIVVLHRAEGNAATFVFTDYLSKVSRDWQEKVGKGASVNWPVGLGAKGDEGVTGLMRQTPGAIGYVDLLYAEWNHVPLGGVRNAAGNFVKASLHSVTEAAASVAELSSNSGVSITNASGKDAYPIASFTWFLVRKNSNDPVRGRDLAIFLEWMIDAGQPMAENLGYAPIPRKLAAQVKKMIAQIR